MCEKEISEREIRKRASETLDTMVGVLDDIGDSNVISLFSLSEIHEIIKILEKANDRLVRGVIGINNIMIDEREMIINEVLKIHEI